MHNSVKVSDKPEVIPNIGSSEPEAATTVVEEKNEPLLDAEAQRRAELARLPLLSELSAQRQRSIPSINFSLHVYSSEQGKGFVTLNGQRRRAGDQVAPGLRLEDIVDDFIVLSYDGSRFRLMSLNSWINLQ